MGNSKAKFRVGQIVVLKAHLSDSKSNPGIPFRIKKFDGIFYTLWNAEDLSWRDSELRPLTDREIDPRRNGKKNGK